MNTISNANLFKLTFYSGIAKTILTIIIGVLSVPFALNYFGLQKFGVWNVISSFVVYFSMTNLGLNAAATILINKNNDIRSKIIILKKSLIILMIVLPIIILILTSINFFRPDWYTILNSPKSIEYEAKCTAIVMIIFSLINVPFSLISSALNGFQKNYIENIFVIVSQLISIASLFYVIHFKESMIFYAYLFGFSTFFFNIFRYIYLRKLIKSYNVSTLNCPTNVVIESGYESIIVTGYRCFLGSIAAMVVFNSDNIIIAKYLGIEFVTPFSITYKLYTVIFSLIYIINSSIIPLIGKHIDDTNYLVKLYSRTFFTVLIIGGLFWVGTVAFGRTLIYFWVGEDGYAGSLVLIFLGGYSYLFAIINLNNIIINSLNIIKGYVYITWFEGLLNLFLSVYFARYYGLAGIALGTFIAALISPFIIGSIFLKRKSNFIFIQNNGYIVKHFFLVLAPSLVFAILINKSSFNFLSSTLLTFALCTSYLTISYISIPRNFKVMIKQYSLNLYSSIRKIEKKVTSSS